MSDRPKLNNPAAKKLMSFVEGVRKLKSFYANGSEHEKEGGKKVYGVLSSEASGLVSVQQAEEEAISELQNNNDGEGYGSFRLGLRLLYEFALPVFDFCCSAEVLHIKK